MSEGNGFIYRVFRNSAPVFVDIRTDLQRRDILRMNGERPMLFQEYQTDDDGTVYGVALVPPNPYGFGKMRNVRYNFAELQRSHNGDPCDSTWNPARDDHGLMGSHVSRFGYKPPRGKHAV